MPTIGGVTETAAFVVLPGMPSTKPIDPLNVEIGRRIAAARVAVNKTQQEIADSIGVAKSRYGNWETGARPADALFLRKMANIWGFSLDWFYRGEMGGVRHDRLDALIAAYNVIQKAGPRRGRPFGRKQASSSPSPPAVEEAPRTLVTKTLPKRRQSRR